MCVCVYIYIERERERKRERENTIERSLQSKNMLLSKIIFQLELTLNIFIFVAFLLIGMALGNKII